MLSSVSNVAEKQVCKLIAQDMPLKGIHLIEASAGTGKTYNITRIYLRLLLEEKLTVKQILVMTFTKDATEEIRGRIDEFMRLALNNWDALCKSDDFFKTISHKVDHEQAKHLLKQALLCLDEAAIFTIHGFCKSVLTEHAFSSDVSFNANMDTQQQSLALQAVQDWYRHLASEDEAAFKQVINFWPVPESLLMHFSKAIAKNYPLVLENSDALIKRFKQQVTQSLTDLEKHKHYLFEHLVHNKKPAEQEKRTLEFQYLIDWLNLVKDDHQQLSVKMPDAFIDGRRFSRSSIKNEIVSIFYQTNQVKQQAQSLLIDIAKLSALTIVKSGIYHIRQMVKKQKRQLNVLSFDDLISTLATQVTSAEEGNITNPLAKTLLTQYPYALVDEFQDTDPEQFSILKAIYYQNTEQATGLMMIGDPKQAIYGFRGGDVFTYMSAREDCDYQWIMDTNWRSSCEMITGYNRLFYGDNLTGVGRDVFGYNIPYFPVQPSPVAIDKQQSLTNNQALRFIHFSQETQKGSVKQSFRSEMAAWCANEIIALLSDTTQNIDAKDIALLVRDGTEAMEVKHALFKAGLPSVYLSNRTNLLHSEQTLQLVLLLKGVLFLEDERLFSASLTCALLPFGPQAYYQLQQDDLAWQQMKVTYRLLRDEWHKKGFITMALKLMHEHMVINVQDSERVITNLLHLFEIIQTASQRHKQPQELLHWFEQQSVADIPDVETELRLESEENLIRIITQHGSKGLEYPFVFVPFATRHKNPLKFGNKNVQLIEYHNERGEMTVSLSGSDLAKKAMADEAYAESIRLLYVAVTRAEQRCYLLSTGFDAYHLSPLGLCCHWQKETNILASLQSIAADNPDSIAVTHIDAPVVERVYEKHKIEEIKGNISHFSGKIERDWWLSSFTALSRNIRDNGVSLPDRDNEAIDSSALQKVNDNSHLLRFVLTKGAHTGNFLHDILEHVDFAAPDWQKALKWPMLKYGELPLGFSKEQLIHWLEDIFATPLLVFTSETEHHFCLSDLYPQKCLREAEFYFPLHKASTVKLMALLSSHRDNAKNVLSGDFLAVNKRRADVTLPVLSSLKGMMHGFIDLIFEHQGKYYICDYKSNHLGDDFEAYAPTLLQQNIEKHNYDLQYLIYALALHRYLKNTLVDYDADSHFGGVYYLYLRGMTSDPKNRQCGVYFNDITTDELESLDAMFKGEYS